MWSSFLEHGIVGFSWAHCKTGFLLSERAYWQVIFGLSRAQAPSSALHVLLQRVLPASTWAAAGEHRLAHVCRAPLGATAPHQASSGCVWKANYFLLELLSFKMCFESTVDSCAASAPNMALYRRNKLEFYLNEQAHIGLLQSFNFSLLKSSEMETIELAAVQSTTLLCSPRLSTCSTSHQCHHVINPKHICTNLVTNC